MALRNRSLSAAQVAQLLEQRRRKKRCIVFRSRAVNVGVVGRGFDRFAGLRLAEAEVVDIGCWMVDGGFDASRSAIRLRRYRRRFAVRPVAVRMAVSSLHSSMSGAR